MTKKEMWKHVRKLHEEMMLIQAADIGYDFEAGSKATAAYLQGVTHYRNKFGSGFDPYKEPVWP